MAPSARPISPCSSRGRGGEGREGREGRSVDELSLSHVEKIFKSFHSALFFGFFVLEGV